MRLIRENYVLKKDIKWNENEKYDQIKENKIL